MIFFFIFEAPFEINEWKKYFPATLWTKRVAVRFYSHLVKEKSGCQIFPPPCEWKEWRQIFPSYRERKGVNFPEFKLKKVPENEEKNNFTCSWEKILQQNSRMYGKSLPCIATLLYVLGNGIKSCIRCCSNILLFFRRNVLRKLIS